MGSSVLSGMSSSASDWRKWGKEQQPNDGGQSWAKWETEDDVDWDSLPEEVAEEELMNYIVSLKLANTLSAKQACLLAFLASRAGAKGEVQKLGLHPGAGSGKYSARFDKIVGTFPRDLPAYQVDLARRLRHDATREWGPVPMIPPHEALANELAQSREPEDALRRALRDNALPPAYSEHPSVVALQPGEVMHPICRYMDGVSFSRVDSCLGVWCHLLLTGRRHLLAVLRRTELCNCGCRGWCSLHPLFSMLAWSFASMLRGEWPNRRHDEKPWHQGDTTRAERAGSPLGWKAVVLFIKGDWSEYSHTLGLPTWSDSISPCPLCFVTPQQFFDSEGLSAFGTGFPKKELSDYLKACEACELHRTLDAKRYAEIRPKLDYDKRPSGSRGRALLEDAPLSQLQKGDRLEPCASLRNVASFEEHAPPCRVVLWRPSAETLTRHRNPLFCEATGIGPQSLGVDWLHTLALGVFQVALAHLFWALISANAWQVQGGSAAILELSVAKLRAELFAWYGTEQKAGRNHCRVQQLLPSMFGSQSAPTLKLHGAETNGMLYFAEHVLKKRGAALGAQLPAYQNAVGSLVLVLNTIREHPQRVPAPAIQKFIGAVGLHLRSLRQLGINCKPKHHSLMEMAARFYPIAM